MMSIVTKQGTNRLDAIIQHSTLLKDTYTVYLSVVCALDQSFALKIAPFGIRTDIVWKSLLPHTHEYSHVEHNILKTVLWSIPSIV